MSFAVRVQRIIKASIIFAGLSVDYNRGYRRCNDCLVVSFYIFVMVCVCRHNWATSSTNNGAYSTREKQREKYRIAGYCLLLISSICPFVW